MLEVHWVIVMHWMNEWLMVDWVHYWLRVLWMRWMHRMMIMMSRTQVMNLVMLVVDGSVVAKGGCTVGHMVILGGNLDMVTIGTMVVHWLMVHWCMH